MSINDRLRRLERAAPGKSDRYPDPMLSIGRLVTWYRETAEELGADGHATEAAFLRGEIAILEGILADGRPAPHTAYHCNARLVTIQALHDADAKGDEKAAAWFENFILTDSAAGAAEIDRSAWRFTDANSACGDTST